MSGYDPKRTRPPAAEVDVDEPAPVDALLDPNIPPPAAPPTVIDDSPPGELPTIDLPAAVPVTPPVTASAPTPPPAESAPIVTEDPIPVDVPVAPAPDRLTARLAIVGGVAAATVAAILLIRRTRRR